MNEQNQTPETTQEAGAQQSAPGEKTPREKQIEKYNKLAAKIADLTQERDELAHEINNADLLASIVPGTVVFITVGRKDKTQEVQGVIAGVKTDEDGTKTFKVAYGSGFDTDVAIVKASKVKLQPTPPAPVAEQAAA